jgi:hypothetical protein
VNIANTWWRANQINKNKDAIASRWDELKAHGAQWRVEKNSAHDESYRTYSHYDAGPREFQVAEITLSDGQDVKKRLDKIIAGIEFGKNGPLLKKRIEQFIDAGRSNKKVVEQVGEKTKTWTAKQLRNEVTDGFVELYDKNFEGGLDLAGYRGYMVALWAALGTILLGGVGAGIFFAGNQAGMGESIYSDINRITPFKGGPLG